MREKEKKSEREQQIAREMGGEKKANERERERERKRERERERIISRFPELDEEASSLKTHGRSLRLKFRKKISLNLNEKFSGKKITICQIVIGIPEQLKLEAAVPRLITAGDNQTFLCCRKSNIDTTGKVTVCVIYESISSD